MCLIACVCVLQRQLEEKEQALHQSGPASNYVEQLQRSLDAALKELEIAKRGQEEAADLQVGIFYFIDSPVCMQSSACPAVSWLGAAASGNNSISFVFSPFD